MVSHTGLEPVFYPSQGYVLNPPKLMRHNIAPVIIQSTDTPKILMAAYPTYLRSNKAVVHFNLCVAPVYMF